ncbi:MULTISPECIES: 50S ribosomal protein L35 [Spiroplasma]|uniref:Large ribosomal subunit protein bL35 n=1 Tax=Spiroplasma alleghenense TaxID=216931 RepID=A0A345Z4H4_9MOLU|nr:50S ribosomal protein L35 [Spiroplasma alleghenense]AXK51503.1 50S ribosomal protein L35 [Spiroplasma alleghenense]
MPKMKTKSSLAKRVRKNAAGKWKRGQAYCSHLAQNKSTKQKRHLKKVIFVHSTDMKRLKGLLQG